MLPIRSLELRTQKKEIKSLDTWLNCYFVTFCRLQLILLRGLPDSAVFFKLFFVFLHFSIKKEKTQNSHEFPKKTQNSHDFPNFFFITFNPTVKVKIPENWEYSRKVAALAIYPSSFPPKESDIARFIKLPRK